MCPCTQETKCRKIMSNESCYLWGVILRWGKTQRWIFLQIDILYCEERKHFKITYSWKLWGWLHQKLVTRKSMSTDIQARYHGCQYLYRPDIGVSRNESWGKSHCCSLMQSVCTLQRETCDELQKVSCEKHPRGKKKKIQYSWQRYINIFRLYSHIPSQSLKAELKRHSLPPSWVPLRQTGWLQEATTIPLLI